MSSFSIRKPVADYLVSLQVRRHIRLITILNSFGDEDGMLIEMCLSGRERTRVLQARFGTATRLWDLTANVRQGVGGCGNNYSLLSCLLINV